MAIQKLPEDVSTAIRSGIAISSTTQCVAELVMNSLDAGASSVVIHLDIPHFKLEVDDNGCGITLNDLHNVGIRYHTSKCRSMQDLQNNLKYNGYRGEALASLTECSGFLVIVTRSKQTESDNTYIKAFTRGKAHEPIVASSRRKNHGTTVTIQDFMCNAPVRQKRIIPNVDIEEIRIQVEGIALSHPHVSFTIIDDSDKSIVRRIPSSSSSLETFTQLYGLEISKNLCSIGSFTSGKLNISGYISTSSYHNKRLQFIFVNGRLVKGTKIHKLINMIMRKSNVLRGNGPWQELPMPDRMRDFLWVSPLKKRDRYCVFMVYISCPISEYDITLDPKKTLIEFCDWDTLFECMENSVKSFLKEHNLALIAPDQEIMNSQSSGDSPLSVINEMEQLEKEDALGQRLSHFRCPVEAHGKTMPSGNTTLNMTTAIHSIPAKRNLGNPFISSEILGKHPSKEKVMETFGDNGGCGNVIGQVRSTNIEDHTSKHAEVTTIDKVELIKFPLLREGSATPVNYLNELQNSSHQFNLRSSVQDSGNGSLGRFRKMFQKTQVTSLKTPDDIQKIVVEEPPPIVRRQAPLEHRIKGCANNKKCINPSINTVAKVFNKPKNTDTNKLEPLLLTQLKEFAFDRNVINNTEKDISLFQKNILNDETTQCSRNASRCNAIISTATQTESNPMDDIEQKCTEKMQNISEGRVRPNLKNLNLRRRQFQETNSYHNRIKVCKYDDMVIGLANEIEVGDKTSSVESFSDRKYENNELSKLRFMASGRVLQKQVQAKSECTHAREKTCTEGQSEFNSRNKPNLTKLKMRRKYFEENLDRNSKTVKCDDLKKDAKHSIHLNRTRYDSQQSVNLALNGMPLPEMRKESEKKNMEMKLLTCEDFICSLEIGEEFQSCAPRKTVSGNSKDTSARFPISSSHLESKSHNPVNVDDEQMSGKMPVLEPYYSSISSSTSGQFSSNDSPPSLLDDEYYPHQQDIELQLELLAPSKEPEHEVSEKMPLNSSVTERNPKKCGDSSLKVNSIHKENFEMVKGYNSINLTVSKPDSCLINTSTADTPEVCLEKNAMNIHNLVPMYNSDSEDDSNNEMQGTGTVLKNYGSLTCSENLNGGETLFDIGTQIINSKNLTQNASLNMDDCPGSDVESASRVGNSQISLDLNRDIGPQTFPVVTDTHLGFDKKQFVLSDISSSQILCRPLISCDKQLEYLPSQKKERTTSIENVMGRISPKIPVDNHGGEKKSPFFADLSEWDAALSEMCHKLENSERKNQVENLQVQSESTTYLNDNKNLHDKDASYQQENRFEMFARPAFCPKGLSPVIPVDFRQHKKNISESCPVLSSQEENDLHSIIKQSSMSSDELSWIKWNKNNNSMKEFLCGTATALGKSGQHTVASLLAETQDKKLISETEILSARIENQSRSFVRVFNLIHPCTFSKEVLSNLKMIGKLDCKFIVAKVRLENERFSNAIVLFDQHAVHERIRLERLTKDYQIREKVDCDNSKVYVKYKSVTATPALEITLNTSEARLLESFHGHFERLGLAFDVQPGIENNSGDVVIKIKEVPACLLSKELKESGPLGLKEQVHSLIREQVEHLLVTRGIGTFAPNVLRDAINMKACRGAVKFGDSLTNQECCWLLRKLSACDTPFQCAHGRPSMYPIIELKQLNRFYSKNDEDCKPRLWRLKKMMDYAASHKKRM